MHLCGVIGWERAKPANNSSSTSAVTVALEEEEYSVREDGESVHICALIEGTSEQEVVLALTPSDENAQGTYKPRFMDGG